VNKKKNLVFVRLSASAVFSTHLPDWEKDRLQQQAVSRQNHGSSRQQR
jgi:hypothetical protein